MNPLPKITKSAQNAPAANIGAAIIATVAGVATSWLLYDEVIRAAIVAVVTSAIAASILWSHTRRVAGKISAEHAAAVTQLDNHRQYVMRVLDALPITVFTKDINSRYTFVNAAFCEHRAMSRDEILTTPLSKMIDEHGRATESEAEDKQVFGGRNVLKEERVFHPDSGVEIFRTVSKRLCHDENGQAVIVGSTQNVSVWRHAEREAHLLHEEQSRQRHFLRFILNTIPTPFYVKDESLRYLLVNHAFVELFGTQESELIGRQAKELSDEECALVDEVEDLAMIAKPSLDIHESLRIFAPTDSSNTQSAYIARKVTGRDSAGKLIIIGTYAKCEPPPDSELTLRRASAMPQDLARNIDWVR